MPKIEFSRVTHADLALLRTWMEKPHWRQWWGEPESELGYIVDMIDGRDSTEPYLFRVDGSPVGYIQVWFISLHQTEEWIKDYPWLVELPQEAVGVDISIGDADQLSKGLGTAALREFVALLHSRGHSTIIIDPDPANARAIRAYANAGFEPISNLKGRYQDVLLMQHRSTQ
jgi:RimJ/RimL family protein N-acetyltransferase